MSDSQAARDPRVNPRTGDVFRKWKNDVRVTRVHQGMVFTEPRIETREWVGIQTFWEWVKTAELKHQEEV